MVILFTSTQDIVHNTSLPDLINRLPEAMRTRARTYKSMQAAINFCVGRLMLMDAIERSGLRPDVLNSLHYTPRDKPLLDGLHFNIAHTSHYVALAYSTLAPMGLDLEYPRELHLPDFKPWFRPDEWEQIQAAPVPIDKFYWYWVRKEAILKATSLSLSAIPRINVLDDNTGNTGEGSPLWHLKAFAFGERGMGLLASQAVNEAIELTAWSF